MKTSISLSNIVRSLAIFIAIASFTSVALTAQTPNESIKIGSIPQNIRTILAAFPDSRTIDFAPQLLAAPFNSSVENTFKVPADGKITLKVKVTNKGNAAVNHTVRIELIDPTGAVKAKINEYIVDNNTPKTATLTAIAGKEVSGCGGANRWKYKVTNNDNVNQLPTLVDASAVIPDATGIRAVYPTGSFSLTKNDYGEVVFQTPVNHNGRLRIKTYFSNGAGDDKVEVRLFKAGVEVAPNESNFVAMKLIELSGGYVEYNFGAATVTGANQFWTVRFRNKGVSTLSSVFVKPEFTDCSE